MRSNDSLRRKANPLFFCSGVIVLGKTLFCNAFEIGHTKEAFILILRFESPDGYKETVYVTISPAGATVLNEHLGKELEDYVKEHGKIDLGTWKKTANNGNNAEGTPTYTT
jgi:hypothetical protein